MFESVKRGTLKTTIYSCFNSKAHQCDEVEMATDVYNDLK